jgi:hypothetical protein
VGREAPAEAADRDREDDPPGSSWSPEGGQDRSHADRHRRPEPDRFTGYERHPDQQQRGQPSR